MSESVEKIISIYERLTDEEQQQLISVLSRHLGKPLKISINGLSICSKDEIKTINNTLDGIILTKENVPSTLEAYKRLGSTDLPQKISFGYVKESGK